MNVIGLTGNTGSGKTTVSEYYRDQHHIRVIDCDLLGHQMLLHGSPAYDELIQVFGTKVLDGDGNISRALLREVVFNNSGALERLSSISHYHIYQEIVKELKEAETNEEKVVIIDAPLLVQSDVKNLAHVVWVVISDKDKRLKRLVQRDKLEASHIQKRMDAQWSNEQYMDVADTIIYNNSDLKELYQQCDKILENYLRKTEE